MAIESIAVKLLRPTQIAVGMRLIKLKRRGLQELTRKPQELVNYILEHPIRVVLGPMSQAFIIDHHHLGCALLKEDFLTAPVHVEDDLSTFSSADFWQQLTARNWVYPFDGRGKKCEIKEIPASLEEMEDDPYRSLAGMVRLAGGFMKTTIPYVEFVWANYFRTLIEKKALNDNFDKMIKKALILATKPEASQLPGFIAKPMVASERDKSDVE